MAKAACWALCRRGGPADRRDFGQRFIQIAAADLAGTGSYRDVWGLLRELGDAGNCLPRGSARAGRGPTGMSRRWTGLRRRRRGSNEHAARAWGGLTTTDFEEVEGEFARLATLVPSSLQPRQLDHNDAAEAVSRPGKNARRRVADAAGRRKAEGRAKGVRSP